MARDCGSGAELLEALPQVAQGGSLCLALSGEGLASVSAAKLGDHAAVLVQPASDALVSLRFEIPHGAARGEVFLELVGGLPLPPGPHAEITAITVGAGGNDESGRGTPASPLATLEGALAKHGGASKGDLIRIEANQILSPTKELVIPDGVDLEGNGATLFGQGVSWFMRVSGTHTLRDLVLDGFPANALYSDVDDLTLVDIKCRNVGNSCLTFGGFTRVHASSTKPEGCLFEKSVNGVYVWGGDKAKQAGVFTAKGCIFRQLKGWGLIADLDSSIVLEDSVVEDSGSTGENAGIYLKNGGHGTILSSTLRNNNPQNILMLGQHGDLQMTGGVLEGGKAGFLATASGSCSAAFTDVSQSASADGFQSGPSCKLSIRGTKPGSCVIEKNASTGVFLSSPRPHEVNGCVVRDNGALGVGVNTGATATITGSTLQHNGFELHPSDAEGLLVAGDATVTVKGGAILENRLWGVNFGKPGAIGATLILEGVDIHDNGQHGVRAAGGKSIKMIGGELRGHAVGAGLSLEAGAEVSLEGALVEGNSTGILEFLAKDIPAKLSLTGCTLRQNELRGLLAQSPELSLSLAGCTLENNNTGGSSEQADLLLARPAKGGSLAAQLSGLTFDGALASPVGALCGASANLSLGGKSRLLNLSDGCVVWGP